MWTRRKAARGHLRHESAPAVRQADGAHDRSVPRWIDGKHRRGRADIDDQLGKAAGAAANIEPAHARGRRHPIQEHGSGGAAPAAHEPFVSGPVVEGVRSSFGHWWGQTLPRAAVPYVCRRHSPSVGLEAGGFNQRGVDGDVLFDEGIEFGRRHEPSDRRRVSSALAATLVALQRLQRLAVQFLDDLALGLRRQKDPKPDRIFGVDKAGLLRRRYVRQRCRPRLALFTASATSLPSRTSGSTKSDRSEEEIDPSGDDLGHRFSAAPIRDMQGLDARAETGTVRRSGGLRCRRPTDEKVNRARLCFGGGDQIAGGLEALRRRNDQDARRTAKRDHGGKIPRRIVAEVRIKRRRDGVRVRVDEQGVAVGVRLGDEAGADRSACAAAVLDDDAPGRVGVRAVRTPRAG